MDVITIDHPIVAESLVRLRDAGTGRSLFRYELDRLAQFMVYEVARQWPTSQVSVETPLGPADGRLISNLPLIVPVMRAGLGMLEGALRIFPDAEVGFLGLKKDSQTFIAESYLTALPPTIANTPVIILDPMLATGGSVNLACQQLTARGAKDIYVVCALTAPEGVDEVASQGIVTRVYTAAIDERLNDVAFILPGLGDAGDRQYGVF
jgi:uracil phosphoribosyltransferase